MSSLSSGQFHEQLPMFMTAHEIDQHKKGDFEYGGVLHNDANIEDFHARKLAEAHSSGLASSIAKEGIKEPLTLWHAQDGSKTVTDGQHRLAVMLDKDPHQLLPVSHEDLATSPHLRPWA